MEKSIKDLKKGGEALNSYFDEVKKIPLLSFEEELELSRRIQGGDAKAREALIRGNLRLVIKIAKYYLYTGVPFMDLIQEGNMGLMRAAQKYDHSKNVRFSTYAAWWIRQAISRSLLNKRRTIKLPHRKEELIRKVQRAYHGLSQTLMRQPNLQELARAAGAPPEDVEEILNLSNSIISLEMDMGDEESTFMELYEDYTYSPEQAVLKEDERECTLRYLNRLKDREKHILMCRFQIDGHERSTLKKIAADLGISPETVRQIELKALNKIKGISRRYG